MNWTPIIIVTLGYFPGMLILLRLMATAQKKLIVDRAAQKAAKNKDSSKNLPKPIWPIWSERLSFTWKDKRASKIGMTNKTVFTLLILIGLFLAIAGVVLSNYTLIPIGYFTFFIAIMFGVHSAKDVLETRKKILKRMFEVGSAKGLLTQEHSANPAAVINVLEWGDYVKPRKVEYQVRTEFSSMGEEGFLQQFNQIFGNETAWVPSDDPEKGTPGWNYDEGKVTLHSVPPLPGRAAWDARYVDDPAIAWSFFPIALGVENGVELTNPETGEIENVLGFDLSGEQSGVAKKAGVKVSQTITTSPMCLVGETLISTINGAVAIKDIAESGEDVMVHSFDNENNIVVRRMHGTLLTRRDAETVRVVFKDQTFVDCTPDHELRTIDGNYVRADLLNSKSRIIGYGQDFLTVEKVVENGVFDVYDGEVEDTHNFVIINDKDSDKGFCSKNCFIGGGTGGGKSLEENTPVRVFKNPENR